MSKTVEELQRDFRKAFIEAKGSTLSAERAGIAAVVRALRDEMCACQADDERSPITLDTHQLWQEFQAILGEAGEKVAHVCDGDEGPSLHQTPATDPAPAVCEWTDYSVSSWKGSHRHEDSYWIRGCDASHVQKYAFGKPCPSCGKPIRFAEAK